MPRRGEEEFLIEPFDVNKAKGLHEEGTLRVSDLGSCANLVTQADSAAPNRNRSS